jgi:Na+/proline symporter
MTENIFYIIFGVAFFSMVVLRIYYGRKARRNREDQEYMQHSGRFFPPLFTGR